MCIVFALATQGFLIMKFAYSVLIQHYLSSVYRSTMSSPGHVKIGKTRIYPFRHFLKYDIIRMAKL